MEVEEDVNESEKKPEDGAVTKLINVEKPVEIERRGVKRRMKDREPEVYESGLRSILPEKEEEEIVDRMDLDQPRKPDADREVKKNTEKSKESCTMMSQTTQLKKDQSWKYHSCLGYTLIILGLGFPVWFATTKVDRASLPYEEVGSLSEPNMTESLLLISDDALNNHQ